MVPWYVLIVPNLAWSTTLASLADAMCQTIEHHFMGQVKEEGVLSDEDEEWTEEDHARHDELKKQEEDAHDGLTPRRRREFAILRLRHPKQGEFDCNRNTRFMLAFGAIGDIPTFFWYTMILPKLGLSLVPKIAVDNFLYSGVWCCIGITTYSLISDGCSCKHLKARFRNNFCPSYLSAIAIYVPFDVPLFLYVAPKYQPAVIKAMDVFYLVIVSYFNNRELAEELMSPIASPTTTLASPSFSPTFDSPGRERKVETDEEGSPVVVVPPAAKAKRLVH
eukprot:Hpha_TRINITY_DN31648_c0_g1::TRINITY_DN31648_c0_g1_i1::g.29196::m.29196